MVLNLERDYQNDFVTKGTLKLENVKLLDTLEGLDDTLLPVGTYCVTSVYVEKLYRNLLYITGAEGFDDARFYTDGAVNVGDGSIKVGVWDENNPTDLQNSSLCYRNLKSLIEEALGYNEDVTLTITDDAISNTEENLILE